MLRSQNRILLFSLLLFSYSIALSKSVQNIAIGFAFLSVLFLAARDRTFRSKLREQWKQPLLLPILLYVSVALVGLIFTENMPAGIGIVNKMAGMLLVYLMVSVLLDMQTRTGARYSSAELLLFVFLAGVFILDCIGVVTYLGVVGHRKYQLPLAPLHVHHIWFSNLNAIGMYAAIAFLIFPARDLQPRLRSFLISLVILSALCVFLSLSRTAWLGIFVTAIVLAFSWVKSRKVLYTVIVGILFMVVMLYFSSDIVNFRINRVGIEIANFFSGVQKNTNIGQRFLMWQAAFKMFLTNPFAGVGTGDYIATMQSYIDSGDFPKFLAQFNQPHNIYLFAIATNGLLGLGALLAIFFKSLTFAIVVKKKEYSDTTIFSFLTIATTVHFMIAGLTDSLFNIQMLRYTFAFIMGVCVRNSIISQSRQTEREQQTFNMRPGVSAQPR